MSLNFVKKKPIPNREEHTAKKLKIADSPRAQLTTKNRILSMFKRAEKSLCSPDLKASNESGDVDIVKISSVENSGIRTGVEEQVEQAVSTPLKKEHKELSQPSLKRPREPEPVILNTAPAYKRFGHLIKPVENWPKSVSNLYRTFIALENVIDFLNTRKEPAIYHKIRKAVENQSGLSFELKHLGQILALSPLYNLTITKTIYDAKRINSYVIEIPGAKQSIENIPEPNIRSQHIGQKVVGIDSKEKYQKQVDQAKNLKTRQTEFWELLNKFVSDQHDEFCVENKLDKPLVGWHSLFDVEKCRDLEEAVLPSLQDKFDHIESLKKKAGIAAILLGKETTKKPQETNQDEENTKKETNNQQEPLEKPTRAKALLEKIRLKEQAKKEQLLKNPLPSLQVIKKRSMLKRFPMIASCLALYAVSCKKTAFPLVKIQEHISASLDQMHLDPITIYDYLNNLCDVCDFFCRITSNGQDARPVTNFHNYCFTLLKTNSKGVSEAVDKELEKLAQNT